MIVVRRTATRDHYGSRAMLNHGELMFMLRTLVLPVHVKLTEWPADGTVTQAVNSWARHDVAVVTHGAGTVNIMFMPMGSTVIEIAAQGQKGMVYGKLAAVLGHHYILCRYSRNGYGTQNLSLPLHMQTIVRSKATTAYRYDMNAFLRCTSKFFQDKYGVKVNPDR